MAEQIETKPATDEMPAGAVPANGNGQGERLPAEMSQEELAAREKARRYRLRYIDLKTEEPAYHLIHELPVELMVRHSFVPMDRDGDTLFVAMADPTNLEVVDEIEAQLHVRLKTAFATQAAIEDA